MKRWIAAACSAPASADTSRSRSYSSVTFATPLPRPPQS